MLLATRHARPPPSSIRGPGHRWRGQRPSPQPPHKRVSWSRLPVRPPISPSLHHLPVPGWGRHVGDPRPPSGRGWLYLPVSRGSRDRRLGPGPRPRHRIGPLHGARSRVTIPPIGAQSSESPGPLAGFLLPLYAPFFLSTSDIPPLFLPAVGDFSPPRVGGGGWFPPWHLVLRCHLFGSGGGGRGMDYITPPHLLFH